MIPLEPNYEILAITMVNQRISRLGDPGSFAGTYELFVCRGGCGDDPRRHAHVQGVLVLLPTRVPGYGGFGLRWPYNFGRTVNGCFQLGEVERREDSFAGRTRAAELSWNRTLLGVTHLDLYQDFDVGYGFEVTASSQGLRGTGRSWGLEVPNRTDTIVATRLGPPEFERCSEPPPRLALAPLWWTTYSRWLEWKRWDPLGLP